jgi:hypothetical protein
MEQVDEFMLLLVLKTVSPFMKPVCINSIGSKCNFLTATLKKSIRNEFQIKQRKTNCPYIVVH